MTLFKIDVYRNTDSQLFPYEPGHALTKILNHWRDLPAETSPEAIASHIRFVMSIDLGYLESGRGEDCALPGVAHPHSDGEGDTDFLLACTLRLLGRAGMGSGDVVGVTANDITVFLTTDDSCSPFQWRRINPPRNVAGYGLTAEVIYQYLRGGSRA
ncbi:hypothetical protein [Actinoplanes sp. NPDC020271]|uniref:hypothetical protein n=1 Tax=Actinoplanes sp. NPDC020271 TaxID=3363896 RepID=UPI0037B6902D